MIVLKPAAIALLALAPAFATGLLLLAREITRDSPAAYEPPAVAPVALALPAGAPLPSSLAGQRFGLVAEQSRAGFESHDADGAVRAESHPLLAELGFDSAGAPASLDLVLDLAQFGGVVSPDSTDLWWSLLGAREDSTARLMLDGMRLHHTSLPQVLGIDAVGTLSLHGVVQIIRLELQLAQLTPGRLRLQAVGEIDVEDFGLPRLYRMLVVPVDPRVTIWVDLVLSTDVEGGQAK